jgi:hypothetical protein
MTALVSERNNQQIDNLSYGTMTLQIFADHPERQ